MRYRVRKRFDALMALLSEEPRDSRPSRWAVPMDDATRLLEARIIEKAPDADTRGWIHPFSVVEEKPSGKRRRWIAWPREKNEQDLYETQLDDLRHISEYMSSVHDECATVMDLKASFFQVSLPEHTRRNFRCHLQDGTLVQLTRLPMGYKASPGLLQIVTSTLAAHPRYVKRSLAVPTGVSVDVWIDNIRLSGKRAEVEVAQQQVLVCAANCGAAFGEVEKCATNYEFLGVNFSHDTNTVKLGAKFLGKIASVAVRSRITVAELEVLASKLIYAAAVLNIRLVQYYFLLKFVRRTLSALNKGLLGASSVVEMSPSVFTEASEFLAIVQENRARSVVACVQSECPVLVTDASLSGWGAVFISPAGRVFVAGGRWHTPPVMIMEAEARAVRLALTAFAAKIHRRVHIHVDNTSFLFSARKAHTKSWALASELRAIYALVDARGWIPSFEYVRSEDNPADGLSRGRPFEIHDWAKGLDLRRGAGKRKAGYPLRRVC
ncbi:putative target of rapamycin (TOR) kinase 1 [Leptomonas pyrrhocoris]|uniref:Putative target of rapamycin (TOR) kinase 1 n=1 Tax=Leptomonas pyrrhocoris TaxID=157538 RepID=A0A0M9FTV8_LEPPY|nr:putative target of rapamycin (TOR) kinase 1 [Leptomonas pyrrhocoris]KPA75766.1 putative target of rapamycin (TOR) kinase 1 [Leptomonas pyrrhocoris]|eukprot:XP_015654205.1 putative target of rapamycin (TOR) kinase 1 [Leptomonas pyrrhocoris]